jgi:hypothetical protein
MTNDNRFRGLDVFGLDLHFEAAGRGSGFAGAAWRGMMGQALFQAVCAYPSPACATCPTASACAYPALFKPLSDALLPPVWLHGWHRGRDGWKIGIRWLAAHHTFAVGEWLAALARDNADLSFGAAPIRLNHATTAATGKPAWRRTGGWLATPTALPLNYETQPAATANVRFITPLVSKHAGDPLFGALHTRLQRLVKQHGDGTELPRPATHWNSRIVARKEKRIPLARRLLSGTEWELELTEIDAAAWPLLLAGVELHAGGQTGMGCGQYEILPAAAV